VLERKAFKNDQPGKNRRKCYGKMGGTKRKKSGRNKTTTFSKRKNMASSSAGILNQKMSKREHREGGRAETGRRLKKQSLKRSARERDGLTGRVNTVNRAKGEKGKIIEGGNLWQRLPALIV